MDAFHALAAKMEAANTKFILEPKLRFEGAPGEQYTMFFEDPSGNSLEFKALTKPENLFARSEPAAPYPLAVLTVYDVKTSLLLFRTPWPSRAGITCKKLATARRDDAPQALIPIPQPITYA